MPAVAALLAVPVAITVASVVWLVLDWSLIAVLAVLAVNGVVTLIWIVIAPYYVLRLWRWLLFRSIVGTTYLDDLAESDWMIEHVLVATDLSGHGSVFFLSNAIQPQVASVTRGFFDGRDVRFSKALRATTALPPILPPTRLKLESEPQRPDSRVFAERKYLWAPVTPLGAPERTSVAMWLADGGVTGNLGIQLDSDLAPDNRALLEHTMAKTMAGGVRDKYLCRWHRDQVSWNCYACRRETIVVDASGTTRPAPRLFDRMLGIPLIGLPVFAVRSLQVMYGSSLTDDQGLAGDTLVGVVSTDQMINRIAMKNAPLSQSENSNERSAAAGYFLGYSRNLAELPELRRAELPYLMQACYAARMASSNMKTRLSAVSGPVAARVVASGYLNACLNTHKTFNKADPAQGFKEADDGIHQLAQLLGPDAALNDWWDGVRKDMGLPPASISATGGEE